MELMASNNVVDNKAAQRFELEVGGLVAVADYRLNGDTMTITHTGVPAEFREQGIGQKLARAALDAARAQNLKVVPQCPFIASFIRENSEYQDLVAE